MHPRNTLIYGILVFLNHLNFKCSILLILRIVFQNHKQKVLSLSHNPSHSYTSLYTFNDFSVRQYEICEGLTKMRLRITSITSISLRCKYFSHQTYRAENSHLPLPHHARTQLYIYLYSHSHFHSPACNHTPLCSFPFNEAQWTLKTVIYKDGVSHRHHSISICI